MSGPKNREALLLAIEDAAYRLGQMESLMEGLELRRLRKQAMRAGLSIRHEIGPATTRGWERAKAEGRE